MSKKSKSKQRKITASRQKKAEKSRVERKKYRKDLHILERVKGGDVRGVLEAKVVRGLIAGAMGR